MDELIAFTKRHHGELGLLPESVLRRWFETYKDTILVARSGGKIVGFGLYQEWPDFINFICVCGNGSQAENFRALLKGRHLLPRKKICFFDETAMKARTICRQ